MEDMGFFQTDLEKQVYIDSILKKHRIFYIDQPLGYNQLYGLYDLIKENFTNDFVICEIGSFAGVSSELFALTCSQIFCVDAWESYDNGLIVKMICLGSSPVLTDDEWKAYERKYFPIMLRWAEKMFDVMREKYPNVVKIKGNSQEEYKNFQDCFFDAVYIDGDHAYDAVKKDILNWTPKIKKDGIICGHDYPRITTVQKAVDEMFHGCEIKVYSDSSWLVRMEDLSRNGF
jgi:predicted O-methyltransferase YrrM